MEYNELITHAIENNEVLDLLRGGNGYGLIVSEFTSDVFPTDINRVLVGCFYDQIQRINNIKEIFIKAIKSLLKSSSADVYIAILYYDTCIYQEEKGKATFYIDKIDLAKEIQTSVNRTKKELEQEIIFENGEKKNNPLKNIESFNKYYEKKYSINII